MSDKFPEQFFEWIDRHAGVRPAELRLKYHGRKDAGFDIDAAITQIECRQKFGSKLRQTLSADPRFVFPAAINGEQASSDILAAWHSQLVSQGWRVADLTAGLGIDAIHLCSRASAVTAIEMQPAVADALQYNSAVLKLGNLTVVCDDCRRWLESTPNDAYNCLFIDPARRADDGSRVYALDDCRPDLKLLQPDMLRVAPRYMAKLSPMLDMSHVAAELPHISHLYAVGTATECKELLAVAARNFEGGCTLAAVTLGNDGVADCFEFTKSEETVAVCEYGMPKPGDSLVVPTPAVMKAAPLKLFAQRYGLKKIAPNTQLYWSPDPAPTVPGTILRIQAVLPYSSGQIKRFRRSWPAALVAVRNFGMTAQALRTKLNIRDQGPLRVYGVTDLNGTRRLLVAG